MKPNLRLFKIFLILIAFLVGNFTFAQQKALTEKEKLAKESQVIKAQDFSRDEAPPSNTKYVFSRTRYASIDYSKRGTRGLLYDNGPFVTHPGGGPGGSDYSQLDNTQETSLGFGNNQAATIYVADDFAVTETWNIDSLVFFGYQTNSSLTSTYTGVYVEIWNGDPSVAGSTIIWGDMTTNKIASTSWTNCYRGSDLVATNRPIMRYSASATGLTLPAGNYWVVWSATGSLSSGPWVPPITIPGQLVTGNAIQFYTGAWLPLADAGSLSAKGLPFQVFGNVSLDPSIIYATDFEDFTAGTKVACQNANWTTWSNLPCGTEDAMISTDFAHSGVNSVKDDGVNDLILPMGNKTAGKYKLDFWIYIPAGHGGYYNILHNFNPSGTSEWGVEFYFEDGGTGQLHAAGQIIPYPYNHDQWFLVSNVIDLDNDLAEVFVDGTSVYSWQWSLDPQTGNPGMNQISAADFYSGAGATGIVNPLYYFDDVLYKDISGPPPLFDPPRNLTATVTGPNVHLTWDPPGGGGTTEELIYDDGVPTDGYTYVGYTMSSHMSPSGPCKILTLKYYTTVADPANAGFEPRVFDWAGTEPGTTILYETTATAIDQAWTEVDISAQNIVVNGDFMVGYGSVNTTTYMGFNTTDNGRAWDYNNTAGTWASWNETYFLRAVVEYTDGRIVELSPVNTPPGTKIPRINMVDHPRGAGIAHSVAPIPNFGQRALVGYNVYRDGTLLNPAPLTDLFFDDNGLTPGTYHFGVTAKYDEGESLPAGPIEVTIISGNIILMQDGTVSSCEGMFYDSGGPDGPYQNNENFTLTITPTTAGAKTKFNFTSFECEADYDFLRVYDGPDVTAPLIGTFTGLTVPPQLVELVASAGNASGAITFNFTSDGSVVKNGWVAAVTCVVPFNHDLAGASVSGPLTPSVGNPATYTVTVANVGTNAELGSNYMVYLYDAANTVIGSATGVDIGVGETKNFPITWTPTVQGPTYVYGKVALTGDENPANDQTANFNINVQPAGAIVVTIGTGTELPGTPRCPFDYFYKNSLDESLYYPEEIGQPSGTQILQVQYHNNFVTNLPDKPVQIWMGETDLMDLTGGYIPAGDLTLVFDGTVTFPSGVNDVTIPLNVPYTYSGGNLVILTYHPLEADYYNSNDRFYSTLSPEHPGRTAASVDDVTVFDPYNPPVPESFLDMLPNTTLFMAPGGGGTIYATDFESFTAGEQIACQDPVNWTTWSNAPCDAVEDGYISTEFAHSPVNSGKIVLNNDQVLPLGNKITGKYELNFYMYVPTGFCGYYNILQDFAGASSVWAMQVYFHTDGTASLDATAEGAATFNYNHDQWLPIRNVVDLDADLAQLYVDGTLIFEWQYSLGAFGQGGPLQLSAADFFGGADANNDPNGIPKFYLDDVDYKQVSAPANPHIVVTPTFLTQQLEPNTTATQTVNIANTGGAALDFNIDIAYPVKSVKIINHKPQAERVTVNIPVKGGQYTVKKNTYRIIPDVVDPASIAKSAPIVNKHAPKFGRANVYVNQTGNPSAEGAIASQNFTDLPAYACQGADDFIVPSGATWNVNHVFVNGIYFNGGFDVPAADVIFYADASGLPGAAVATYMGITAIADATGNVNVFLPTPAIFTEGHYWVSVAASMDYTTHFQWMWSKEAAPTVLNELAWQNPGAGFPAPVCTSWCYGSVQWPGYVDYNLAFALTDSTQAPPPTGWLSAVPLTGSVPAGGSTDVQVTFDATGLEVGTYNGLLSINSNDPVHPVKEVPATLRVKVPGALPFVEDWSTGSFGTNDWGFDPGQGNWAISTDIGNPAPSAQFGWSPSITNYSFALVTPMLNATAITDNVTLKFDIYLNNYSNATLEGMAVEVFDGSTWQLVQNYDNSSGNDIPWTSESFNITSFAAGHNFSVRFRAYGENSFNIDYWYVDNIKIYQQVVGNLTGTITTLTGGTPIEGALVTINNALSGTYTATSGANGVYTITGAEAGAYNFSVVKEGFNKIEGNLAIVGNETVTQNFQMTAPIIGVDPTSLSVTVPVGETTTRTVTVSNTGDGPLNWSGSIHSTVGPVVFYSTDFESFTAGGQIACQDPVNWTTWSLAPCSPVEDGYISTEFAHSGVNSAKIVLNNDQVLPLGNKTAGKYELNFYMYVPTGFCGYYNILQDFAGGSSVWAMQVYFHTDGTASLDATAEGAATFNFNHDQWIPISNVIDLDADLAQLYVDGTLIYEWQYSLGAFGQGGPLQISASDFFGGNDATNDPNGIPKYYLDDMVYKSVVAKKFAVVVPASDGKFPRGTEAPSIGRAPAGNSMPSQPLGLSRGSLGYAFHVYSNQDFFSFNTDDPATQSVITTTTVTPQGGSFDAVHTDFMYILDGNDSHLKKVVLATGAVTDIGLCNSVAPATQAFTGIAVNKSTNTMYGISTDISVTYLYTINMETAEATVVGSTGIPAGIDCAIDADGIMWVFDIVGDEIYKVDLATGASTLIGSAGFDGNYGQGMGYDYGTDQVYLTAFNGALYTTEFRILDRTTGNTTLVADLGSTQIDGLGFPGGGGGNWASIDPTSGTIVPGGSQEVTVTFDGTYVPPQKDLTVTGVLAFTTDPNVGSPEVALSMTITGPFFGVLEGTVTHGGTPVEGVTVKATRQESPVYTFTMLTSANGTYSFPNTLYGTYDLTAEKTGFNPYTSTTPAIVVGDQTTVYNIAMLAPIMVINPLEINDSTAFGTIITKIITVSNTGDGSLDWAAVASAIDKKLTVSIPASDGKFPRGTEAPSIGRAPAGNSLPSKPLGLSRGSLGYAFHVYSNQDFFSFNTDDPANQSVITSTTVTPQGGSFDAVHTDFMYILDGNDSHLKKVDIATGTVTDIGLCNSVAPASQIFTGIAVNKSTNIMYGISTDISSTYLYTINMETAETTVVGSTGIPAGIDCAIDADGIMWVFDIVGDEIYKVDLATGASTLIGSAGFDGNYGQGMGYDYGTDQVYLMAFNGSNYTTEFRILDRTTGNTNLVASLGSTQIDGLGFPGGGTPPWLSITPTTGILPAGASQEMTVTLDGTIPPPAKDYTHHGAITFSSDPNVGTVIVPVTFTVTGDFYGKLEGFVKHNDVGIPNATVTAIKPGTPTYTTTTDANGRYVIDPILGGTYEVTATAVGYHPASVSGVVITPPNTTMLDLILTAPTMVITPSELTVNLPTGQTTDRILSIYNGGDGMLEWSGSVHINARHTVSILASDGKFPRGTEATSIGRAPAGNSMPSQPLGLSRGSLGYAFHVYSNQDFFSFNTDDPANQSVITSTTVTP
ncbi:MAG: carboxypeptidase regulatory-like domain-containing protein, partial [Bacteroidales bacterium]|nr:carboxypeptidase regulatory-like domain-containing protein [Bacteroidales bacterium]